MATRGRRGGPCPPKITPRPNRMQQLRMERAAKLKSGEKIPPRPSAGMQPSTIKRQCKSAPATRTSSPCRPSRPPRRPPRTPQTPRRTPQAARNICGTPGRAQIPSEPPPPMCEPPPPMYEPSPARRPMSPCRLSPTRAQMPQSRQIPQEPLPPLYQLQSDFYESQMPSTSGVYHKKTYRAPTQRQQAMGLSPLSQLQVDEDFSDDEFYVKARYPTSAYYSPTNLEKQRKIRMAKKRGVPSWALDNSIEPSQEDLMHSPKLPPSPQHPLANIANECQLDPDAFERKMQEFFEYTTNVEENLAKFRPPMPVIEEEEEVCETPRPVTAPAVVPTPAKTKPRISKRMQETIDKAVKRIASARDPRGGRGQRPPRGMGPARGRGAQSGKPAPPPKPKIPSPPRPPPPNPIIEAALNLLDSTITLSEMSRYDRYFMLHICMEWAGLKYMQSGNPPGSSQAQNDILALLTLQSALDSATQQPGPTQVIIEPGEIDPEAITVVNITDEVSDLPQSRYKVPEDPRYRLDQRYLASTVEDMSPKQDDEPSECSGDPTTHYTYDTDWGVDYDFGPDEDQEDLEIVERNIDEDKAYFGAQLDEAVFGIAPVPEMRVINAVRSPNRPNVAQLDVANQVIVNPQLPPIPNVEVSPQALNQLKERRAMLLERLQNIEDEQDEGLQSFVVNEYMCDVIHGSTPTCPCPGNL